MLTSPPDSVLRRALTLAERARAAECGGASAFAVELFEQAVAAFDDGQGAPLLADLLRWKGTTHRNRGEQAAARDAYRQSLAVANALHYENGRAHALNCLGTIAQRHGDLEEAERLFNEAAMLAAGTADSRLLAMVQQNLGVIACIRGDVDVALVRYRMAMRAFVELGDAEAQTWVHNNLGMLFTDRGEFAEAAKSFDSGSELARTRGDMRVEQAIELNRVEMLVAAESWVAAQAGSLLALRAAERRGDPLLRGEALKLLGVCERARDDLPRALEHLERARECADEAEDALLLAEVLREVGETLRAMDRRIEARAALERAGELFTQIGAVRDASAVQHRLDRLIA